MHADRRWGERVIGWEEEGSPVLTVFVRGRGRTGEDVVPF